MAESGETPFMDNVFLLNLMSPSDYSEITSNLIDDDIEDEEALLHISTIANSVIQQSTKRNKRVKIEGYVENVVNNYLDDDFQRHFRVRRTTFEIVLEKISPSLDKFPHLPGQPRVKSETQLLITLWILANQESYRSISDRFNISKSTAVHTFDRVIKILNQISPELIRWPTDGEITININEFSKSAGFPGVIGAIDGTHIPVKLPSEDGHTYINRKGFPSIILQAICNHKLLFIDCFAGYVGSVHDARVLRASPIYGVPVIELENQRYFPGDTHLLGDPAYPLSTWLITPFKDNGSLHRNQKKFNTALAKTRTTIERAFGLLKCRFRRLLMLDMKRIEFVPSVILACCVLHNICIFSNDELEDFWQLDEELEDL